jgi:hypothetical protein
LVAIARSQRGWLTPDLPADGFVCRQIFIPNSVDFQGLVDGALSDLASPWNYQKWGTLTPEETAEYMAAMLVDFGETGCGDTSVPTPYWDEDQDLDDQEPVETQTWYGIFDGEFHETVENFVIAGFLAYSGNIGAAISFLTIAPRFRLAWKTGNLGGIIRVIIDGADAGTVDTFSAVDGIIERDFVGDPDEDEHRIITYLESVP